MKHRIGATTLIFIFLALLLCASSTGQDNVTMTVHEQKIDIEIDGTPFTSFYYKPDWPKPFLHPLRSPSGVELTRRYPIEKVEGETHDHEWHRGLWWGHGAVQGVDFWREIGGGNNFPMPVGEILFRQLGKVKGNRLSATYDFMAAGRSLASLVETFSFSTLNGHYIIDAEITVKADRGSSVKMGDTEEGTFAARLRDEMRQDHGADLINAEGLKDTENIWGKPSPWVDYSSTIEGDKVGIAIFDHPKNPKHPTHWHARGYGLLSANPFGMHDFYGDPSRDGGVVIPKGKSLTMKYRVVIHQGSAAEAGIPDLYAEYAK